MSARSIPYSLRRCVPWTLAALALLAAPVILLAVSGQWEKFFDRLAGWKHIHTWIVLTAAVAAMTCALPGNFLLLRRQSMMGDALSHTVLPGIVVAFLISNFLMRSGRIDADTYHAAGKAAMFAGAIAVGVLTALLTEWVRKLGRVESSASLGVVYTTLFAVGLLLIRVAADNVHIDQDCVLFGNLETVVMGGGVPPEAKVNAALLALNLLLLAVFFKELQIGAFDPALATTLGINARLIHYALMGVTAATLVAAFESVGSILVIAMLIVPPATARLLTDQLWPMILFSLLIAAASAALGLVMALTLPAMFFSPLDEKSDFSAGTAGMMSVAAGLMFLLALLFAPRQGVVSRAVGQMLLGLRIAGEDLLGLLYRLEERGHAADTRHAFRWIQQARGQGRLQSFLAVRRLVRAGKIERAENGYRLTDAGREEAKGLVRSHRLWESYLAKHFPLPDDHLHESAERVEHFVSPKLREELAEELDQPEKDPHGRSIPPERDE